MYQEIGLLRYYDIFSRDEDDLGYFDQIEHRMHTTSDVPNKVRHRNIPPHHRGEEREYLQKSLDRDAITPSSSPEPLTIAPLMPGYT